MHLAFKLNNRMTQTDTKTDPHLHRDIDTQTYETYKPSLIYLGFNKGTLMFLLSQKLHVWRHLVTHKVAENTAIIVKYLSTRKTRYQGHYCGSRRKLLGNVETVGLV